MSSEPNVLFGDRAQLEVSHWGHNLEGYIPVSGYFPNSLLSDLHVVKRFPLTGLSMMLFLFGTNQPGTEPTETVNNNKNVF